MATGRVIAFRIQPELQKRVEQEARRLGVKPTDVARIALAKGLQQGQVNRQQGV